MGLFAAAGVVTDLTGVEDGAAMAADGGDVDTASGMSVDDVMLGALTPMGEFDVW